MDLHFLFIFGLLAKVTKNSEENRNYQVLGQGQNKTMDLNINETNYSPQITLAHDMTGSFLPPIALTQIN